MPWIPIGIIVIRYSMDSVQRRRETQFSTPMEKQLIDAVDLRIAAETTFKKQIVLSLTQLIDNLEECDPSNARTTLDLTQDQLRKIIIKLNDKSNIDSSASETIANIVRDSNLLRRSQTVQPPPLPQAQLPTQPQLQTTQSPAQAIQRPAPLPINPAQVRQTQPQAQQQQARPLGTRTMLDPLAGGRRTKRKRKTRR